MKTWKIIIVGSALAVFLALDSRFATLFAQGALTPPGPPAPTMRTLLQIEPRTPISSAPFVISTPGSYFLTTNITAGAGDAIDIATNGVTLDLRGFTISSVNPAATGAGILLSNGISDVTIVNGHIVSGVTNSPVGAFGGKGFGYGIEGLLLVNVRVEGVSVSGCRFDGITVGGLSTLVESCAVQSVGGSGIQAANVSHSVAYQCAFAGIIASDTADNCYGQGSLSHGVVASSAENCVGFSNSQHGVEANTAHNCYGQSDGSGDGVFTTVANNCFAQSLNGKGIETYVANSCFGHSSSGTGISARTAQNCYGTSGGAGAGLDVQVAIGCNGSSGTGFGISAFIANSCVISSGGANITHSYNMP
jgi:hypothetical protein